MEMLMQMYIHTNATDSVVRSTGCFNDSQALRKRKFWFCKAVRDNNNNNDSGRTHPQNIDLPPVLPKYKKKPFVLPPKRGGYLSKKGPKQPLEQSTGPPGNGLLVAELIPVAHAVYEAREALLQLVPKLIEVVPVKVCKFCLQTHVGPVGHDMATCDGQGADSRRSRHVWINGNVCDIISEIDAYHSYDRLRLIRHEQRLQIKRLPALVELCIQAGVDLPEYPTLRRTKPVRVSGARVTEAGELISELQREIDSLYVYDGEIVMPSLEKDVISNSQSAHPVTMSEELSKEIETKYQKYNTDLGRQALDVCKDIDMSVLNSDEIHHIAEMALQIWEVMRDGAKQLMNKYTVRACGYCPEVHIGPRGHKVRLCGAYKHQWRQGQHGWQVAGLDDLIPPKYVWHVPDIKKPLLTNELKSFYGQAPAIVELCVQAGAEVPSKYRPMMRTDVIVPDSHEFEKVV